ncbi:hypothetical protein INE78_03075 [Bacteroides cellulosilyticus]|jgi:hypothetical protein|nr:hypothetical protein INE78_03075 [Bacteroides cellulosilyticus]
MLLSPYHLRTISVLSPYYLRVISVLSSYHLRVISVYICLDLIRGWYRVDMNLSSYVPAIANLFFTLFYVF